MAKFWCHYHFPIYGKFGAIRKVDSRHIVCKTYIFINSNLLSYKNWKQNYNISNTTLTLLPWVKVLFLPKKAEFLPENADISKIKRVLVLKGTFSETGYVCVSYGQNLKFQGCIYGGGGGGTFTSPNLKTNPSKAHPD